MESDNLNFNELWSKQRVEQPALEVILSKIDNYKKKNIRKILIINVFLAFITVIILSIWFYFQPQFLTTKIGILFIILAMFVFVISYNKSLVLLKKTNDTESNQAYLKNLHHIREKQVFLQTKILSIYFILLSVGIALYLYEFISRMSDLGAILTYGITGIWILVNWIYFRPVIIKKQQAQLNDIIKKLENLQQQLKGT